MTPPARALLIGVDGGGSGCRAALRRDGAREVHLGAGGPANVTTDADGAIRNVRAAIAAAAAAAGAGAPEIAAARAHLGLAGSLDAAQGAKVAAAMPMRACTVSDDAEIQVAGALGDRDGFVLAIGTGTIVARRRGGEVRRIGGWGLALSDRGSGADLGREALRRTLLCEDGMAPHSALTRELLAAHGGAPAGLVAFAATAGAAAYAALAPRVIEAASGGDPNALAVIGQGAAHLDAALAALGLGPGDVLCLTGGIGPRYGPYLASARKAELVAPSGTALDGALARAAELPHPVARAAARPAAEEDRS